VKRCAPVALRTATIVPAAAWLFAHRARTEGSRRAPRAQSAAFIGFLPGGCT
jgi:hypothetical protein